MPIFSSNSYLQLYKHKFIFFLFVFFTNGIIDLNAQNYEWEFMKTGKGSLVNTQLLQDGKSNKYIIGTYKYSFEIDTFVLTGMKNNIAILKYNSKDSLVFVKNILSSIDGSFSTNETNIANIITTMYGYNNILIGITFSNTLYLANNDTIVSNGLNDILILNIDTLGDIASKNKLGGVCNESISGLTAESNQEYYISGAFGTDTSFPNSMCQTYFGNTPKQANLNTAFLVKFNNNNEKWIQTENKFGIENIRISNKTLYVNGGRLYTDTTSFGNIISTKIPFTYANYFTCAYDTNGIAKYIKRIGINNISWPYVVSIKDNVGYKNKFITYGYTSIENPNKLYFDDGSSLLGINNGNWDYFISLYDTTGNLINKKMSLSGGDESIKGIHFNNAGNVLVMGNFDSGMVIETDTLPSYYGDIFLIQYDSLLNFKWSKRFGNIESNSVFSTCYDENIDALYVVGNTSYLPLELSPELTIYPNFFPSSFYFGKMVNRPLSQQNIANDNNVKIYPNPSASFFTIENNYSSASEIAVVDLQGKKIIQNKIVNPNSSTTLDLSNQAVGIYLVEIKNNNTIIHKKIIKK